MKTRFRCDVFFSLVALASIFCVPARAAFLNVSGSPGDSVSPDIAVGPGGVAHIVWSDATGGTSRILYRTWTPSSWGEIRAVSDGECEAARPSVEVDPDGTLFIAWQEEHQSASKIYACLSDGETFLPFPVAPELGGEHVTPRVHCRPDGSHWVSWLSALGDLWVSDLDQNWKLDEPGMCLERRSVLAEVSGRLVLVSGTQGDEGECDLRDFLWEGSYWNFPAGDRPGGGFELDGTSLVGSDVVHLASHPGALPACPCWDLVYTCWNPLTEWTQEVMSETFSEWWFCTQPSVAVDSEDRAVAAYMYEELDLLWETVRKDVVIARRSGEGIWEREYLEIPLDAAAQEPVVDILSDVPVAAWSAILDGAREICLWSPAADVPQRAAGGETGLSLYPNPSGGPVHLALNRCVSRTSTVEVFDVSGRFVRRLLIPPGRLTATWDGEDAAGAPVGSGIYMMRILEDGGPVRVLPIVRIR